MMNIDIATLKSQVRSGLAGTDYSLVLSSLGSPTLTALANEVLPGATLRLSAATLAEPPDGQSIIVHGTGVDLPFTGLRCAARFSMPGGAASLQLSALGDHTWLLSTGFPPFSGSLADDLRFADSPPPALYLYSDVGDDGRPAELTFEGSLDLNVMTAGLSSLLGRQYQPVSGPFVLEEQGSVLDSFSLTGETTSGVHLGIANNVDLTFGVDGWLGTSPSDGEGYILPYLTLSANISFSAQGKSFPLPVTLTIFDLQGDFRFETDLTGLVDAAVDEIKALTQHIGLDDILPKGDFQLQNYLSLSNFFFDFNPTATPRLTQIGVDVQNAHPWTIVHLADSNKNWVLDKAMLSFRVRNPGSSGSDKSLSVSGELKIGSGGVLLLSARYPMWEFDFALKEGTVLNLTEVLEEFMGSAANVPELEVHSFELHVASGNYSLILDVHDDWVLADNLLSIQEVGLTVEHQAGGSTQVSIQGVIDVSKISVIISADYQSDPGSGWFFQGSTGPDQSVPIGQLIDDLTMRFGAVNLPASLEGLTITNLSVSFHTTGTSFTFTCESQFPVEDTPVDIILNIAIIKENSSYTKTFSGTATIGTRQFILFFSEDATSTLFLAEYANPGGDKIKIKEDLVAPLSADIAQYIPAALEIDFKDVLFVFDRSAAATQPTFLFGLDLGATIPSLSNLPLVGQELSAEQNIKVDNLRVLFTSQALTANLVANVNGLLMSEIAPLPAVGLSEGLTLSAAITFGSTPQILTVPIPGVGTPPAPTPPAPGTTSTNNATWFSLQKSFGPLHFNRVGVQYQDAAVWFLLDAALSLAGLTLSLDGLAVGSPLTPFAPEFQLRGLGLDCQSGPLEIGGSFLHTKQTLPNGTRYDEYDGAAFIKTEELTISALGSYALLGGNPSLFIYAVLDYPLGGPSFFFITGLTAGFGYNRSLAVPAINQVAQFPLVAEAVSGATPPQSINDIGNELAKLEQYIHPEVGETFFAVGIRFTSFKIIDSFVLVTVAFGNELEVNVLGLSTLILPTPIPDEPPVTPLAVVQMAVKASYIPAQGFLGVSAQLTSASYLLSNSCLLTGGFAFYSWFAGEHNGDFVQTLGGYHPSFVVPAHYPTVPRLAYSWQVDSQLSIKGQAYCALTASALMAGMQIQANWDSGDLRAWFSASFDFLISWKPFHYDISAHVNLGASYTFWFFGTQTISFDVGADLHIWGPEFSGTAHINLSIISFDVSFGANSAPSPTPIDWVTFKKSFLPADTNVAGISVKAGLLNKTSQDESDLGVLDPKTFSLVTNSVVPSTSSRIATGQDITVASTTGNGFQPYTASGKPAQTLSGTTARAFGQVAIGPMGVQIGELVSMQTITITHNGNHVEDQFVYTPVLKSVPVGLWGHSLQPDLNGPRFVDNAFAGFEIAPAAPSIPGETAMLDRQALRYEPETIPSAYAWASNLPAFEAEQLDDVSGRQKLSATLAAPAVTTARQHVLAALGIDASAIDLGATLASTLANEYVSAPQIEKV